MRLCVSAAALAGSFIFSGFSVPGWAAAQGLQAARSDIMTVFGFYGVTGGNSDRSFATAWGNTYLANGMGLHAEAHYVDREETAQYFAGGLSWGAEFGEIRGWLGTSTENSAILPELYGRFEGVYRTRPETGIVISPALNYRRFRNGAEEASFETQIAKYIHVYSGKLIATALARANITDPGSHLSASFGAGLIYAHSGEFSVGLMVEGGRAAYDGFLAPGKLDEHYVSVRPAVSFFLTEEIEIIGLMDYSIRESYAAYGGYIGLKLHLDHSR